MNIEQANTTRNNYKKATTKTIRNRNVQNKQQIKTTTQTTKTQKKTK